MTAGKNISASNAASERQIRRRRKKLALKILENTVLLAVAAIILFPILWMVMTAFKPNAELVSSAGQVLVGYLNDPQGFNVELLMVRPC